MQLVYKPNEDKNQVTTCFHVHMFNMSFFVSLKENQNRFCSYDHMTDMIKNTFIQLLGRKKQQLSDTY